ncbi:MAG TPA: hypothetical protein VJU84_01620 [Pyrinomonadaceae bacterium]|nr:hypothetical protein [Pyrinomonadaceae bacterium]
MSRKNSSHFPILVTLMLVIAFGCKFSNRNSTNSDSSPTPTPKATPLSMVILDFDSKKEELGKFTASTQLDTGAGVKGKVAIVEGEEGSYTLEGFDYYDYDEDELEAYGLTKDDLALRVEEIDTLVQTNCSKGRRINSYTTSDGKTIPAYALECETLVFDYKAPAVIARKKFRSEDFVDSLKVSKATEDITAIRPTEQVQKFIKGLRSR